MDPFNLLPLQIVLQILKDVPDFVTLQLFLESSPAVNAVFNDYATEVINDIATFYADAELGTYLFAFQAIHTGDIKCETVEELFCKYISSDAARRRSDNKKPVALDVVRRSIQVAANVERLTMAVLEEFRRRLSATVPLELDDPESLYGTDFENYGGGPKSLHFRHPNLSWPFAGSESPPASPVHIVSSASSFPATRWEFRRVHRAIWSLQIVLDAKKHLQLVGWPDFDESIVDVYRLFEMIYNAPTDSHAKEVAQCLLYLAPRLDPKWSHSNPRMSPDKASPILLPRLPWCSKSPAQAPLWSQDPAEERVGCFSYGRLMSWSLQRFIQDRESLSSVNPSTVIRARHMVGYLGLCIWGETRLGMYGLCRGKSPVTTGDQNKSLLYTWWSVLFPYYGHRRPEDLLTC